MQKTFSTPNCRSCLERMADGVLLLDQERRVLYVTPQAERIAQRQDLPFVIAPKFELRQAQHAVRFAAFAEGRPHEAGPLSLLLEDDQSHVPLLVTCFRLPSQLHSVFGKTSMRRQSDLLRLIFLFTRT